MAVNRRLQMELQDLRTNGIKGFRDVTVDEVNIFYWEGLLLPENAPYNKGAFRIEINIPTEFPFKPPEIIFKTRIYHPNILECGRISLPIVSMLQWSAATRINTVVQAVVAYVNDLEPFYPALPDLAIEYAKDREQFIKKAEKYTLEYGEPRPAD